MKLDRTVARKLSPNTALSVDRVTLSASESISFVWELTKEVFSLTKKYNVESRLQRNVVNIARGRR